MFSRDFRRPKRAKFKIYFNFDAYRASVVALSLGRWWCPLGAGGQAFGASGVLRCVFCPFCPLYCLSFGAMPLKYASIRILRAFPEGFGVVVWVCSFWVLCVACVAFVRVWS